MSVVPRGYGEATAEVADAVVAGSEPQARAAAQRRRARRAVAARGAHRVLTVLALVGSLHALFLMGVEGWRFVSERRAVVRLQQQVGDLQSQAQGLKQVIDHAGDQHYREDLARRQGFMYPQELRAVTQQPPAAREPSAAAQPPTSSSAP